MTIDRRNDRIKRMDDSAPMVILLGREHSSLVPMVRSLSGQLAVGISPGYSNYNEDAVGMTRLPSRSLLVAADGHWGDHAAMVAVTETIRLMSLTGQPRGNEPFGWFYAIFERINRMLLSAAVEYEVPTASESSLLVAHIVHNTGRASKVHWASFGDSYLYLCPFSGFAERVNSGRLTWLGAISALAGMSSQGNISIDYPSQELPDEYVGIARGLEIGMIPLHAGDVLVLATDGLPQCRKPGDTQLTPDDISRIIRETDEAESACYSLIQAALAGGGVDNITCAVYCEPARAHSL